MIKTLKGLVQKVIANQTPVKPLQWYEKEPLWSPCRRMYDV